jgi:hypothetical protein
MKEKSQFLGIVLAYRPASFAVLGRRGAWR